MFFGIFGAYNARPSFYEHVLKYFRRFTTNFFGKSRGTQDNFNCGWDLDLGGPNFLRGDLGLLVHIITYILEDGVFATKDFGKGDFLLEYRGRYLKHAILIFES